MQAKFNNKHLLSHRLKTIEKLAAQPRLTSADIGQASGDLNISRSRLYFLIRRCRNSSRNSVDTPRGPGLKAGSSLISVQADALITTVLQTHFLNSQKPRLSRLMRLLQVEAHKAGIKCPARGTVQHRIGKIDRKALVRSREGGKVADDAMRPVVFSLSATRPMELLQVDHTLADIIIVDDETRRPLQRPWLTIIIDVASRMVAGYHLSLDPPSSTSVALALHHAVLPKETWLAQRGISASWPVSGLPELVHMDNAKEFHSLALSTGLHEHGIRSWYRPVRRPHFGGHIERLIGTIMWDIHNLPGTTFSNIQERGAYDAEQRSAMTLEELDSWLAVYIVGYHNRIHSGLLRPPLAVWNELSSLLENKLTHPADRDAFYLNFLPIAQRMIRRDGIKLFNISYWDDVLGAWAARTKKKYWVRYDPRDMSQVYLKGPDNNYWRIRTRNLGRPRATLWELSEARKKLRDQGRQEVDEQTVFDALEAERLIVGDATTRTKLARRRDQRLKQALKSSTPALSLNLIQGPDADIVSDGPAIPFEIEEWS